MSNFFYTIKIVQVLAEAVWELGKGMNSNPCSVTHKKDKKIEENTKHGWTVLMNGFLCAFE